MSYDDDTLMAFADGELDDAQRAEIAAAIEKDPALRERVEQHRALRAEISGAFGGVLDRPVPERLRAAARGEAAQSNLKMGNPETAGKESAARESGGNVVQFPKRSARVAGPRWGAREWTAMAASLLLGVLISWRSLAPRGSLEEQGGALVARGELASALDRQLASNQPAEGAVHIGLTFRARDGAYCRSFTLRATGTSGLACRAGDGWRVPATTSVETNGGMQQAAGTPPVILQAIQARIAGEPLDAAGEQGARDADWKENK